MDLTDREVGIMHILWNSKNPMTASEIKENSHGYQNWSLRSFFTIIDRLVKSEAVSCCTPYAVRTARTYIAAVSPEDCVVFQMYKFAADIPALRERIDKKIADQKNMEAAFLKKYAHLLKDDSDPKHNSKED